MRLQTAREWNEKHRSMMTMRDPYTIDRYEPGYDFDSDPRGSAVYYEDMVILIDKIKAGHSEEATDLRDALADAVDERDAARAEAIELRAKLETVMRYVNGANELHAITFRE